LILHEAVSVQMNDSIGLSGLATSVQALESSISQCAESSIHHATIISTKPFTATFTSLPAHVNTAPGQGDGYSFFVGTTLTQGYAPSGSGITLRSSFDVLPTNTAIIYPFSVAVSSGASAQKSASASALQSLAPNTSDSEHRSSSQHSLSTLSVTTRYNPPQTMATIAATKSGNLTSPKSSVIAFTGSSSTTTKTSGAMIIALLFTVFLL
jgi:hypothetical protein